MERLGVSLLPWMGCQSIAGSPQHFYQVKLPWQFAVPIYSWVERSNARVKYLSQEHSTTQWPRPALKPGPLYLESNAQTIRPAHFKLHMKEIVLSHVHYFPAFWDESEVTFCIILGIIKYCTCIDNIYSNIYLSREPSFSRALQLSKSWRRKKRKS